MKRRKVSLSHDLIIDQLLQLLLAQIILILIEIEELLRDGCSGGLILRIMVGFQVGVLEGFVDGDALDGVECQELLEQVECEVGGLGEHAFEGYLLFEWERADVFPGAARLDAIIVFHGGGAENIQDQGELVVI
jgi:hypothetical protein